MKLKKEASFTYDHLSHARLLNYYTVGTQHFALGRKFKFHVRLLRARDVPPSFSLRICIYGNSAHRREAIANRARLCISLIAHLAGIYKCTHVRAYMCVSYVCRLPNVRVCVCIQRINPIYKLYTRIFRNVRSKDLFLPAGCMFA